MAAAFFVAVVFFAAVFLAAVFFAVVFLAAVFFAGAFLAPFFAPFAGPRSRRSVSRRFPSSSSA